LQTHLSANDQLDIPEQPFLKVVLIHPIFTQRLSCVKWSKRERLQIANSARACQSKRSLKTKILSLDFVLLVCPVCVFIGGFEDNFHKGPIIYKDILGLAAYKR
jgi:hypothetical protein